MFLEFHMQFNNEYVIKLQNRQVRDLQSFLGDKCSAEMHKSCAVIKANQSNHYIYEALVSKLLRIFL